MLLEFTILALSGVQFILVGGALLGTLLTEACVPLGLMMFMIIVLETSTFVLYMQGHTRRMLLLLSLLVLLFAIGSSVLAFMDLQCLDAMQGVTPAIDVFVRTVTVAATGYVFVAFVCLWTHRSSQMQMLLLPEIIIKVATEG